MCRFLGASVSGSINVPLLFGSINVPKRHGYAVRDTSAWLAVVSLWSGGGSNSRPSHCERDALPAELPPHKHHINTEVVCVMVR